MIDIVLSCREKKEIEGFISQENTQKNLCTIQKTKSVIDNYYSLLSILNTTNNNR